MEGTILLNTLTLGVQAHVDVGWMGQPTCLLCCVSPWDYIIKFIGTQITWFRMPIAYGFGITEYPDARKQWCMEWSTNQNDRILFTKTLYASWALSDRSALLHGFDVLGWLADRRVASAWLPRLDDFDIQRLKFWNWDGPFFSHCFCIAHGSKGVADFWEYLHRGVHHGDGASTAMDRSDLREIMSQSMNQQCHCCRSI